MFSQKVKIADVVLDIVSDYHFDIPDKFHPFLTNVDADYIVRLTCVDQIPEIGQSITYAGDCFSIASDDIEIRYFHPDFEHANENYAIAKYDFENRQVSIRYTEAGIEHLNSLSNIFFHVGWEEILLHESRMVIHSCCMHTELGGILFSGPSGIGKSTQGELWKKYEDAQMINGDRPIIYKEGNFWRACGSPYAGSSRCYVQGWTSIRAIVMLKQSAECRIHRLSTAEAYRKIYAMLTVCDWNMDFMDRLLAYLSELVSDIPVYQMECTPDQRAVDLLKSTLLEESDI